MDKIGEYIPLIIIALSFIYSFARKAGKKAAAFEEEVNKTTLPNALPQKNVTPKSQVVPHKQVENKKRPATIFQTDSFAGFTSGEKTDTRNGGESSILMEEIIDDTGIPIDFSDAEELKKGIIYAEIFNRRY